MKSPSDTAIYAPALNLLNPTNRSRQNTQTVVDNSVGIAAIDQISDFVERMRVETERRSVTPRQVTPQRPAPPAPVQVPMQMEVQEHGSRPDVNDAQHLVETEQFKTGVTQPKGMLVSDRLDKFVANPELRELVNLLLENDDDKYFHLTCHIDPSLKVKIEAGAYVDLEKLLLKTQSKLMSDEQRMQFVNKDGASYWVPADRDNKITGIRKWDQAFRIYAAIYCKANPARSSEIWQYIYVINTAATSYSWENVTYYDFTFRQLMGDHPNRNWGKTYLQLWNLAMCEPLNKGGGATSSASHTFASEKSPQMQGNWQDCCCWRYNRGAPCKKWNCGFDHHCSYCGAWDHSSNNCPKKKANQKSNHSHSGKKDKPNSPNNKNNNHKKLRN